MDEMELGVDDAVNRPLLRPCCKSDIDAAEPLYSSGAVAGAV